MENTDCKKCRPSVAHSLQMNSPVCRFPGGKPAIGTDMVFRRFSVWVNACCNSFRARTDSFVPRTLVPETLGSVGLELRRAAQFLSTGGLERGGQFVKFCTSLRGKFMFRSHFLANLFDLLTSMSLSDRRQVHENVCFQSICAVNLKFGRFNSVGF